MIKRLLLLIALIAPFPVGAQNVQYVTPVTRNHVVLWNTNGVIADGGSSVDSPITSLGVTNNGGAGFCVSSDRQTAAGRNQLCFGASSAGPAVISLQNYGTAAAQNLQFVINGTSVVIPTGGAAFALLAGSSPYPSGDLINFSGSSGLLGDSGISASGGAVTVGAWRGTPIPVAFGGTGASTGAAAQINLGLGTMAVQNFNAVAITGGSITGMPSPVNATDVAIKSYVDSLVAGLIIQPASRLATAAILPNTPTYANGTAGVGATLTAGGNSTLTVDGNIANLSDVVLVKNQASAFQNGIYTVSNAGSGSAAWVLTRATYFDQSTEMLTGSYTFINVGSANANTSWVLSATVATVGTTAANFNQYSASGNSVTGFGGVTGNILVGNGLQMSGSTLNANGANATDPVLGNVTLGMSNCGQTVQIGTGTTGYFTFTLPAASSFFEGCWIGVKNGDGWTGRGKALSGFPSDFTNGQGVLWPNQAGVVQVVNGAWTTVNRPGRAKLPSGTVNFYSDFSNTTGDNVGNDCMSATIVSGTGPCQHVQNLSYFMCNEFDGTSFSQTRFTANAVNSGGGRDQVGVHYACHGEPGLQGGAAFIIQCGTGAGINGVNTDAVAAEVGAKINVVGCILSSTGTIAGSTRLPDCIRSNYAGSTAFAALNTFGNCAGARYNASNNAEVVLQDNDFIQNTAVAQAHWRVAAGGTISTDFNATGITTSVVGGGSTSVSSAWAASNSGTIYVPGWSLASGTVSGIRELTTGVGSIWTGTNSNGKCTGTDPVPYLPGSVNGTTPAPYCV